MAYGSDIVLLVEDDADDAEMTMYALSKLKISVLHLDDGAVALDHLFSPECPCPSLILLDLKMPKVDGIEILSKLKADRERKKIPVVALISSNDGRKYVESFHVNPDGYLLKPVECKSFITVLTEIGLANLLVPDTHNIPS